jgi:Ca2+-binding RTX toxin-like protein
MVVFWIPTQPPDILCGAQFRGASRSKAMVSSVTIHGSNHSDIAIGFDTASNLAVAQQLSAYLDVQVTNHKLVTELDSGGTFPALPSGVAGAYVQSSTTLAILPTGYTTDLITKPGPAVVFGSGAANQAIMSDINTNLTFNAAGGSGTVVAGGGTTRLLISGEANQAADPDDDDDSDDNSPRVDDHPTTWTLYTGAGNDFISVLGNVNATIGAGGGHNTIMLGSGRDVIVSTGSDTILGGSGTETIEATSAQSDYVQGGNSKLFFLGGGGDVTIIGGSGSDTYMGSSFGPAGKQLIEGGSAGNNFLFAGDGAATLVGGGNGDQLFAFGGSNQWLKAGSGNETLSAALSTGQDTLTAGSGKDLLITGFGSNTVVGGSGKATVNAAAGNNVFEFIKNQAGGTELVTGMLDPSAIRIALVGYGGGEVNHALSSASVKHGSITIGLTDGTKITFQDVTTLTRSNFI